MYALACLVFIGAFDAPFDEKHDIPRQYLSKEIMEEQVRDFQSSNTTRGARHESWLRQNQAKGSLSEAPRLVASLTTRGQAKNHPNHGSEKAHESWNHPRLVAGNLSS